MEKNNENKNGKNPGKQAERVPKTTHFDPIALDIVKRACELEGRNFSSFMAWASLKMAKAVLSDELPSGEGHE